MSHVVIDVREPFEFAQSHVAGALNVPLSTIQTSPEIEQLESGDRIVAYCNSGSRSAMAVQMLQSMGFKNSVNGINQSMIESQI